MSDYTDKTEEFIESIQVKLEEIKQHFLKESTNLTEKDVVLILDIKRKGFLLWRFDA